MNKLRIFLVLLAFTGLSVSATAQTWNCGAQGNNVIATLRNDTLTISGSGDMVDYGITEAPPWYSYRSSIISIVIGDSITSIGSQAFNNCSSLTSVTIPDGITFIGDNAFVLCSSLHTVNYNAINCTMTTGMQDGGGIRAVFVSCPALITLNIGDQVENIPNYAFLGCANLISVTIPDRVIRIGASAFASCKMSSLTIGNSVTSIGDNAFALCRNLSSITCKAIIPPVLETTLVFNNVPDTIPVSIPCQSYDSYNNDLGWNYFSNFINSITDTTFYTITTCSFPYTDNNFTNLTKDSVYYNTLQMGNNCDSIICLTLSFYPSVEITNYSATICEGRTYSDANFTKLTKDSVYYDTLQNVNGCDSVLCLTLTVNSVPTVSEFTIDNSFTLNWQGNASSYKLYRNDRFTTRIISLTGTTYTDNNLTDGETYCYKIKAIDGDCESDFSDTVCQTFHDVGIVGVENFRPLRVYPNPTTGQLRITNYELRDEDIEIYDVVGRIVGANLRVCPENHVSPKNTIDVSHLAKGMYYLKVGNKVMKFVKE